MLDFDGDGGADCVGVHVAGLGVITHPGYKVAKENIIEPIKCYIQGSKLQKN